MRPLRLVSLAATVLLLSGCGDATPDEPAAAGDAPHAAPAAEAIGFGEALAQIRGHHLVSLELYRAGDLKAAAVHAAHPISEILTSLSSELDEHAPDVTADLEHALEAGVAAIAAEEPASEVAAAYEDAAAATEAALDAFAGDDAASSGFQGSVIAVLLGTAAHEYEEAVGPDGIRLLDEYQDGYGFVREARRLYEAIAPEVEQAAIEEAEEIEEAFAALEHALPSPQPPRELADPLDVESAAELIGHELEETVGAAPAHESDPAEIVAEIEELLDEIETSYEAGDADAAAELSAEAYLENYEVIEAEVIEKAPDVNEELEPLLGAELRKQIGEGAPIETIQSMISRAKELLAEALAAIAEE